MKRGGPLRRLTPLQSRSELRRGGPLQRGGPLNPVSDKRRREQRSYTKLRRQYLVANPWCAFPKVGGCVRAATEIHHKRGRVGALYLDTAHWAGLCHDHHVYVTDNPQRAYDLGISERRVCAA